MSSAESEFEVADEMAVEDEDDGFIKVALHENADFTEFPREQDDSVLFSTIKAQFPEATGIRYKGPSGAWRAIRDVDNVLKAPKGGWGDRVYCISVPESLVSSLSSESFKRKTDSQDEEESDTKRPKRLDKYLKDLPVTSLPFALTDAELREYLETNFGPLDLCEIKRDAKGDSRGFGFVRFQNKDHAVAAINAEHKLKGRNIVIKIKAEKPMKLFIGRLPKDLTQSEFRSYFAEFGEVQEVFFPKPFKQFAFLTYANKDDAKKVMRVDHEFKGMILNIEECEEKDKDGNFINKDKKQANNRMDNQFNSGNSFHDNWNNQPNRNDGYPNPRNYPNPNQSYGYQSFSQDDSYDNYYGFGSNRNQRHGEFSSYNPGNRRGGYHDQHRHQQQPYQHQQTQQQPQQQQSNNYGRDKSNDLKSFVSDPKMKGELKEMLLGILAEK